MSELTAKTESKLRFDISTTDIFRILLLFALTWASELPQWKWILFVLTFVGLSYEYHRDLAVVRKSKEKPT